MSILLNEMAAEHREPELAEDIALLRQQVDACAQRLQAMTRSAREAGRAEPMPVTDMLDQLLDQWQLMRPQARYRLNVVGAGSAPVLDATPQLRQALTNLLNNAVDASNDEISIELDWDATQVWLRIRDTGPGLPLERSESLGHPFVTTKGRGLGIGLFLTATTLAQQDGDVRLYNHPAGGTLTEVRLPLTSAHRESTP
jgi:two-component system sensor histidine kinase RegB